MNPTTPKLSARQVELLERICLKRYQVVHEGYIGSWRPHESVRVTDTKMEAPWEIFRPSTLNALCDKGLANVLRAKAGGNNSSEVKPTAEGIAEFKRRRADGS